MRSFATTLAILLHAALLAGSFTLRVDAPDHGGKTAVLYRYDDLFTLRTVRVSGSALDAQGSTTLSGEAEGTMKYRLRVGDAHADLYLRPGSVLHVHFPLPNARTARSLSGTTRVEPTFLNMDPLDINALTSDLNGRMDAFIAEDLASDEAAGMQALDGYRRGGAQHPDSLQRPSSLFITPTWSTLALDSFEIKLRRFYSAVDDPWFGRYLDHALAGLRQGPHSNALEFFERYLKGRPVSYDDPEYVRTLRGLFNEHLLAHVMRHHEAGLMRAMRAAHTDSLKALFARHDFLKDDDRLCELVMLDQLYLNHATKLVVRESVVRVMADLAARSAYAEHRHLAANMHWDLTAMHAGSTLPAMRLQDLRGHEVDLESQLDGATCIAITASWCTYCEAEMAGLEKLHADYKGVVRIVVISLDPTVDDVKRHVRKHPGRDFTWLHALAEQQLRDDLRLRSLPAFYLLNGSVLVSAPAPTPSTGLGEWFHRAKVAAERDGRIKVWDD